MQVADMNGSIKCTLGVLSLVSCRLESECRTTQTTSNFAHQIVHNGSSYPAAGLAALRARLGGNYHFLSHRRTHQQRSPRSGTAFTSQTGGNLSRAAAAPSVRKLIPFSSLFLILKQRTVLCIRFTSTSFFGSLPDKEK